MRIHYEELFTTATGELVAANLYIEHLLWVIDEIKTLNKDTLLDKIIENWLERYELDKMCHARVLFDY
jgi:hypothetical protein